MACQKGCTFYPSRKGETVQHEEPLLGHPDVQNIK